MLAKFEVYQLSLELYRKCRVIPASRTVKDQLDRASLSICLNLAEGFGKPSWKEKRRYYAIALGSCRETEALLEILEQTETKPLVDRIGGCLYRLVNPR